MYPDCSINIYTGWTQKWTSPKRFKKKKYIDIHEVVRGPFSSPRLISTQPFITFSSYQQRENYSDVRRGIPDTWKEYLISKGFCKGFGTKAYVLQKNLIPFCTRYIITDRLWNDTRLSFIQGIPDPWKTRTLHRSESSKYSRSRFSRAKNICSTQFACVYDGDDEAEIERGVPCQFNKDHIDDKKDPPQEGHRVSNYSLIERTFKDNLEGVRKKEKRYTSQLSFQKDSKLSNRRKPTERVKHDQCTETVVEKTRPKSQEIISNKNLNRHTHSKHHKKVQLKDKKQFASKNDLENGTITEKEGQATSKNAADGIAQTSIILKDKIGEAQESFPRKHIDANTQMYPNNIACCNCILHNYMLSSIHYFRNCTSPLKDVSLSNSVLCQECENIYRKRKPEKLISPTKKLEFCTSDPKTYTKHKQRVYMKREKNYEWTKQKLCTCMQKMRKQFGEQNRLDHRIRTKDAIVPKQELNLMCYYCNSPDLKIEKICGNTSGRNTRSCIGKKTSIRPRNEQNKIRDCVTKHLITKSRRNFIPGSKKHSYTCIGNKRHVSKRHLDWASPSMTAKWGHNMAKKKDCEFSKKNNCHDKMLKVETERTRIDKETKGNESTETFGNIVTGEK